MYLHKSIMKIVYCIPSVYNSGGMERILSIKSNYLIDKGFDVYIVTTDQKGRDMFFFFSREIHFIDLKINYSDINGSYSPLRIVKRVLKGWLHRKRLKSILYKVKPDVTISMFQHESSFLYKIKDGSTKIIESHFCRYFRILSANSLLGKIITKYRTNRDAYLVGKYYRFVTLTHEDKSYWPLRDNILVIPNPITISCNKLSALNGKQVLAVGRFSYQKGFDRLIKAWNIVNKQKSDWSLKIVGSQSDKKYTKEVCDLIIHYKLSNVILAEETDSIDKEYLKSSFLVMSSRYEGFGLVLVEGMSCGLPCISFDCKCGPRDIITDGEDGLLVEEGNIQKMAEAILKLMTDSEILKVMSVNAKRTSESYAIDLVLNQWVELFQSCPTYARK